MHANNKQVIVRIGPYTKTLPDDRIELQNK